MRQITYQQDDYEEAIKELDRRPAASDQVRDFVATTLADVKERGDAAVIDLARKFDKAELTSETLAVSDGEFATAEAATDEATCAVMATSHANVLDFAQKSLRKGWSGKNAQGAEVGEVYHPFERVGCYVPGGSAPLVSTVLMTVTLAAAAGVPEIVVCTPCGASGEVNPALLVALKMAGATEVYKIGGAQAIAAMAIGTETIRPVAKVFGPGNPYVVEAKRQVFGIVAVDLLPGPSEIMVLADETGRPDFIAADLLAQAEHGGDSDILFVTNSAELLSKVDVEIVKQAATLSRQAQLTRVLEEGATSVLVERLEEGVAICNAYAPEHLALIVEDPDALIPTVRTAGAIFVGNFSPVAVGDFLAGPSHTLPTGGAGKSFPGLTVDAFQRRTSVVRLDETSAKASAPLVSAFAAVEGLDAHARSAEIRAEG